MLFINCFIYFVSIVIRVLFVGARVHKAPCTDAETEHCHKYITNTDTNSRAIDIIQYTRLLSVCRVVSLA